MSDDVNEENQPGGTMTERCRRWELFPVGNEDYSVDEPIMCGCEKGHSGDHERIFTWVNEGEADDA